jgi:long-chain acyl-CoA synthetase
MNIDLRYTVSGLLRANTEDRPDNTMFVDGNLSWTWAEHHARASKVGNALRSEGMDLGSRIAFLDRNGIQYFETLFGGALGGMVNVAVNWRLAASEMAGVIDDSTAEVLVISHEYMHCLAQMESGLPSVRRIVVIEGDDKDSTLGAGEQYAKRLVSYEDWIADQPESDLGHVPDPAEVSLQLYTSGTTGLPKGVMLTNSNLASAIGGADSSFQIGPDIVSLVAMPLFHIGGTGWALCAMSRGGKSVILRDVDPRRLLDLVETERISHMFVVPALLMMMLAVPELAERDTTSLREVYYGASPIAEEVLVSCLRTYKCHFTQVYGMTETTGAICALVSDDHDPDGPRRHLLRSAGKALPGVELRIADPETGAEVSTGSVGELLTRSPYTMLGYWEKPQETAAAIDGDGWMKTGDAGFIDEDGYLFLSDRIKDMIVSGGENIYPAEVENILLSHGGVVDAAVIGVPDDRWGETVKAIVVFNKPDGGVLSDSDAGAEAEAEAEAAGAELIELCRARLAHYKCPTSVNFVETLPRNPTGKILKRELREPFWKGRERHIQ